MAHRELCRINESCSQLSSSLPHTPPVSWRLQVEKLYPIKRVYAEPWTQVLVFFEFGKIRKVAEGGGTSATAQVQHLKHLPSIGIQYQRRLLLLYLFQVSSVNLKYGFCHLCRIGPPFFLFLEVEGQTVLVCHAASFRYLKIFGVIMPSFQGLPCFLLVGEMGKL